MKASPSALRAHATHLESVTKNVRSRGGHGWTYDDEIVLLRDAADELTKLRACLLGAADQIESAGDDNPDHWATDESRKATIKAWAEGVRAAAK